MVELSAYNRLTEGSIPSGSTILGEEMKNILLLSVLFLTACTESVPGYQIEKSVEACKPEVYDVTNSQCRQEGSWSS